MSCYQIYLLYYSENLSYISTTHTTVNNALLIVLNLDRRTRILLLPIRVTAVQVSVLSKRTLPKKCYTFIQARKELATAPLCHTTTQHTSCTPGRERWRRRRKTLTWATKTATTSNQSRWIPQRVKIIVQRIGLNRQ